MRRAGSVIVLLVVLAAFAPARAAPGGLITTPVSRFVPDTWVVAEGSELTFANLDSDAAHSVTSDDWLVRYETRLFNSGVKDFGESGPVRRVEDLDPGEYGFHCAVHPGMTGTLVVL